MLGGVATGSLGAFGLGVWAGSPTADETDPKDEDESEARCGSACEC